MLAHLTSENVSHCCFSLHLFSYWWVSTGFLCFLSCYISSLMNCCPICVYAKRVEFIVFTDFLLWCSSFIDLQESFFWPERFLQKLVPVVRDFYFGQLKIISVILLTLWRLLYPTGIPDTSVKSSPALCFIFSFYIRINH